MKSQTRLEWTLVVLAVLGFGMASHAQWVAFNDHYVGPTTHPNATAWNVFGTTGGAPGRSGPLKNIIDGAPLSAVLTITNTTGVGGGQSSGEPSVDTPAHSAFHGYVDFSSGGGVNHSITINASATMAYVITGLNPNRRYNLKATGVRGNPAYTNRWIVCQLDGAESFVSAHTANVLTSDQVPSIGLNEGVLNTGANHTYETGDVVSWDAIAPGEDGVIVLYSRQYRGPVPGGDSMSSYGYGLTALRLEEVLPTPVTVVSQPRDVSVCPGLSAPFSVSVTGSTPYQFQWFKDGLALYGATNASYVVPAADPEAEGEYAVVVSNPANTVTSLVAHLTIGANPVVITTEPESQFVDWGEPVALALEVNASSSQPISYRWHRNSVSNNIAGTSIPGATNAQFAVPAVMDGDVGFYYVIATNCANSVTSAVVTIGIVYVPVELILQPQDITAVAGGSVVFSVEATGSNPQFQWFKGNTPIPDATNATLSLTNLVVADSSLYHVTVANPVSQVISRSALLTVTRPPYVLVPWTQPWRYNQLGDCLGAEWYGVEYPEDATWPSGPGALALENQAFVNSIRGTVLSLTSPSTGLRVINYYFRTSFNLTNDPREISVTASNVFDDAAVVYLNGIEAYRVNLSPGPLTCSTVADGAYGEGTVHVTNLPSSLLVCGTNVLAVEVFQVNATSADVVMGLSAEVNYVIQTWLEITRQPESVVAEELKTVTLSVGYSGEPAWFQWYQRTPSGPQPVPEANKATLTLLEPRFGVDDGAYFVVVSNVINQLTSSDAWVSLVQDTVPPVLVDADGTGDPRVIRLTFSEPVFLDTNYPPGALTDVGNYSLTNTFGEVLEVESVTFTNQTQAVLVSAGPRLPGRNYIVTLGSAQDLSPQQNLATNLAAPVATLLTLIHFVDFFEYIQPLAGLDPMSDFTNGRWFQWSYDTASSDVSWFYPGQSAFQLGTGLPPVPSGTQLTQGPITTYFRKTFDLLASPAGASTRLRHIVDDGAVIYLNGREVERFNMPPGEIGPDTPAAAHVRVPIVVEPIQNSDLPLVPGNNAMAAELHAASINELTLFFAMELQVRADSLVTGAVCITTAPRDLTVAESTPAMFTFQGVAGREFQWRSNGVDIVGATNPIYTIPSTPVSADGARYSVLVIGLTNAVESAEALLTVLPDTNAPTLVSAYLTGSNTITVSFSESMRPEAVRNTANFAITNTAGARLNIIGVELKDGTNAVLTVSELEPGAYTVVVSHVQDNSSRRNPIVGNSRMTVGLDETVVIAVDAVTMWRYNEADVDLGTTWLRRDYNDSESGWKSGPGVFAADRTSPPSSYGGAPVRTQLTLEGPDGESIPSYYFRIWFNAPVVGPGATLTVRHLVDDGVGLFLNGDLVHSIGIQIPPYFGFGGVWTVGDARWEGPFSLPTTNLLAGANLFAAQLKQANATSADAVFAAELRLSVPSVVLPAGGPTEPPVPDPPFLFVSREDAGQVKLWWTNSGVFTLESTGQFDASAAPWSPVTNQANPYSIGSTNAAQFYRLKH